MENNIKGFLKKYADEKYCVVKGYEKKSTTAFNWEELFGTQDQTNLFGEKYTKAKNFFKQVRYFGIWELLNNKPKISKMMDQYEIFYGPTFNRNNDNAFVGYNEVDPIKSLRAWVYILYAVFEDEDLVIKLSDLVFKDENHIKDIKTILMGNLSLDETKNKLKNM